MAVTVRGGDCRTVRYHVCGIVQGVGFRPFTAVTAEKFGIRGTVANKGSYVEIIAQGMPEALSGFADAIRDTPPDRAVILSMDSTDFSDTEAHFRIAGHCDL